ncbi:hypothetical protein ASPVEDRAFT_47054 [Aspergillus versicolor CBS 583.65]|uniref:Rhodopsin domain-containing protein n=1 Tax=Aspergillus versicolor CBS 583.65 TaxID=1036611 RepID=A0A1L9Q263_ASPVE|nr:uncharacterized protein ASPVEDRAFT_47054 [Aspergillus versicolor CBS 583.65]OJJ07854.1 hypothetical protein ASPVEDRAFT_47054 [Aspergillus versicolor CBS 583.65]
MSPGYLGESTVSKQRVPTLVLPALAICFLVCRLISRRLKRLSLGIDDYTLIVGQIFVISIAGINYAATYYGMGRHMAAVMQEGFNMVIYMKLLYAFEPLYITAVAIIKFSVLLMYNRIFPVRSILVGSYILGGITLAWLISVDLVAIFQCTPIKKAWLPQTPGTCIDLKVALIANGIPNFVTDILILTLPGRSIWKLQASVWQRVSIIGVFLSGSLYDSHAVILNLASGGSVVFASIYRFSLIFQVDMDDIPWTIADAQTWCVVETSAGIISACLPTVVPLIKLLAKGVVTTATTGLSNTNSRSRSKSNTRSNLVRGANADVNDSGNGHQLARLESRGGLVRGVGDNYNVQVESGTGNRSRGSLHNEHGIRKTHGWTVIEASGDSD